MKSLLKFSYWVFIACDEIPKSHFNATFYTTRWTHMKTKKCYVNVSIKIKKPRLFHVWLFGVDLTMCISNKRPIIFEMQSNIASYHATWILRYTMVVNNRKTSLRAVGFGLMVNIRDKINLETSENALLEKNWLFRYRRNTLVRCLYWR